MKLLFVLLPILEALTLYICFSNNQLLGYTLLSITYLFFCVFIFRWRIKLEVSNAKHLLNKPDIQIKIGLWGLCTTSIMLQLSLLQTFGNLGDRFWINFIKISIVIVVFSSLLISGIKNIDSRNKN